MILIGREEVYAAKHRTGRKVLRSPKILPLEVTQGKVGASTISQLVEPWPFHASRIPLLTDSHDTR